MNEKKAKKKAKKKTKKKAKAVPKKAPEPLPPLVPDAVDDAPDFDAPPKRIRLSDLQAANTQTDSGIRCPRCNCGHWKVVYTRARQGHLQRRRECRHCGKRITTRESSGPIV